MTTRRSAKNTKRSSRESENSKIAENPFVFNENINNTNIFIFDHLGKVIKEIHAKSITASEQIELDVSRLSSGIYFIHILTDTHALKKSFIVGK